MASDRLKGRKTLAVSNFLDEFEKDDIKKQVDIVELFGHFNIELKKKGTSYVGLCPWHKDSNPSLSVDKEKGLYHCFGCGESGDIFTLVEKMKGLDFKESVKFLKDFNTKSAGTAGKSEAPIRATSPSLMKEIKEPVAENKVSVKPSVSKGDVVPGESSVKIHKGDETKKADSIDTLPSLSLKEVVLWWHKNLKTHKKAQNYLESRKLYNVELLSRFKIGFSDGTLTEKISEKQKKSLITKGILTKKGTEFFYNSLVVPVFDEHDQAVHVYGRSITSSKVPHKYLKGKHRSIFNRKASKVYDEIILTESLIDALSLIALGFENVQALYGTHGFTDEHLQLLKDDRVKTVVLALDNDEAGFEAAEKLQQTLVGEGFLVKAINPGLDSVPGLGVPGSGKDSQPESQKPKLPKGLKDWNNYLVHGGDKETVTKLIAEAEEFKAEKEGSSFKVEKDNLGFVFTIHEIIYRVIGAKEIFVSNLKVNIKAEDHNTGLKYYDNLDLYSARSRNSYASNMGNALDLEAKRIEKDLITILEYLEKERDRHLMTGLQSQEQEELTEAEKELGMSLLTDPDMFDQIVEDMELLGYVGEDLNKQLMYLAATSRKLKNPISVMVISESASGKSYLIDTVAKMLPQEDVISATSLSEQALNYMDNLNQKFLSLGEIVHSETVEHQIREMLSKKELSRLVATKEPQSGKLVTKMSTIPARVSLAMSGTNRDMNPENTSRCFVVNTDESREQTRRIHKAQWIDDYNVDLENQNEQRVPEIVAKHRAAQRLLEPLAMNNIFGQYLDFPNILMRTRRDNKRFIDLIASVCYVRQFQKERHVDKNGNPYIAFDLTDYEIAYNIMVSGVLSSSLLDIPRGAIDLYKAFRDLAQRRAAKENIEAHEITLTQREIRESTGFNQVWIKRHIRILVDYEYIVLSRGGTARSKGHYRLREDVPMEEVNLTMIPTPEELKQKMKGTDDQNH